MTPDACFRFLSKIRPNDSGCWLWTGATTQSGHGEAWTGVTTETAHRVAWRLFIGPIPQGLCVLHRQECANPACVRPDHTYLGTRFDNARDWKQWGRRPKVWPPSGKRKVLDSGGEAGGQ